MCRQCQFFGHVTRGSAGKELRECIKSSDKKIGRGRRKLRWIYTVSEMTGEKGIEKNLKLAENRLEWRRKIKDCECNSNLTYLPKQKHPTTESVWIEQRRRTQVTAKSRDASVSNLWYAFN